MNAQVGGKLAQIGSRLVDGAAAKIADDFFACFVERLGGGAAAAAEPVVAPTETATTSRTLWLRLAMAAAIIVAIFIYWLTRPA